MRQHSTGKNCVFNKNKSRKLTTLGFTFSGGGGGPPRVRGSSSASAAAAAATGLDDDDDDDDDDDEVSPPVCPGFDIRSRFLAPFAHNFPFPCMAERVSTMDVSTSGIVRSTECTGRERSLPEGPACEACTACGTSQFLLKRSASSSAGSFSPTINNEWLSFAQLSSRSTRHKENYDAKRLQVYSLECRLARAQLKVSLYEKLVHYISTNPEVSRVAALLRVCLKNGMGVKGILQTLEDAVAGLYKAKSFQGRELDLMLLLLRMGGRSCVYAVSHALGFPSVTTALVHVQEQPLFTPTYQFVDVGKDLESNITAVVKFIPPSPTRLVIMTIDEAAVKPKLDVVATPDGPLVVGGNTDKPGVYSSWSVQSTKDIDVRSLPPAAPCSLRTKFASHPHLPYIPTYSLPFPIPTPHRRKLLKV